MKQTALKVLTQLSVVAILFTACNKKDVIPPIAPPPPVTPPAESFFTIKVKAAITVGDVVYDSIPANFTITSWDANGVAQQKDTALNAGAQAIHLPKEAIRYSLKLNKWGITDEKVLNRADITDGALYQLGGNKAAKKLQSVSEYTVDNGVFVLNQKQDFEYDAQGRINEIHLYALDQNGVLSSNASDIFLYGTNELWVNSTYKKDGVTWAHNAYTFDGQGRTIQTKSQYLTQNTIYTNQYTSEGIRMLAGQNATDPNGQREELRFTGGNLIERKSINPGHPTSVTNFKYDFNINPYVLIKMPSLFFEHSSKNNVVAEGWEGSDKLIYQYSYDSEGYVTEVISKDPNTGRIVSKTVYNY